jgi:hypothetical protein
MLKLIAPSMAIWLCAMSTAGAGSSSDFSVLSKPLPPAKSASRTGSRTANPCASFGPNFKRIEGSDTCVKIGGAVSVEAGSGFGR